MRAFVEGGADLISMETFLDIRELRAAVIACREFSKLPIPDFFINEGIGLAEKLTPFRMADDTVPAAGIPQQSRGDLAGESPGSGGVAVLSGISATMLFNLPQVIQLVERTRTELGSAAPRIILGGGAFRLLPELPTELKVDAVATELRQGVELARSLGKLA